MTPSSQAGGQAPRTRRPSAPMVRTLRALIPRTSPTMSSGRSKRSSSATDIPTETKNSPISSPRKGSMSASSSWRYSESARSTPADGRGEDGGPQSGEQRRGGEDLLAPGRGHQTERGPEQRPADEHHEDDQPSGLGDRDPGRLHPRLGRPEQRHDRQQGDHRQVLEEEDPEGRLPHGGRQLVALAQQLEREGGGGEGEPEPRHQRAADDEDPAPELPQPLRLELEPDEEEQEHHAGLGDVAHLLDARDEPEAMGADERAGDEVTEHRAQAEPLEERDGDDDQGQEEERLANPEHARRSVKACRTPVSQRPRLLFEGGGLLPDSLWAQLV